MSDLEIVKALECCKINRVADCKKCAFHLKERKPNINCVNELIASSIDLINRLQTENEKLSQFGGILLHNGSELFKELQTAKAEAYKEFAERLKTKASDFEFGKAVWVVYIDNLLKEIIGE